MAKNFDFLHDTGSTYMSLFNGDVQLLQLGGGQLLHFPPIQVMAANNTHWVNCIQVQVSITANIGNEIIPWRTITAIVYPGNWTSNGPSQMSGMFLRHNLFTATAPDGQGNPIISTRKTGIVRSLPAIQNPQPPQNV
jgi:hypothetical protein